jgi:hypothetical protein
LPVGVANSGGFEHFRLKGHGQILKRLVMLRETTLLPPYT